MRRALNSCGLGAEDEKLFQSGIVGVGGGGGGGGGVGGETNSSGHHYMSGNYNIWHYVMTW